MKKLYLFVLTLLIGSNIYCQSRTEFINQLNQNVQNTFPNSKVILEENQLKYMIFSKDYDAVSFANETGIEKKLNSSQSKNTKDLFMKGFSKSIEVDAENYIKLGILSVQAYITTKKKKYLLGTYYIK